MFVFAVPAYDNGNLVSTVVATRTISDISRELVGVTGENQDNFLCDKHGNIVAVPAGKKFKIIRAAISDCISGAWIPARR